MVLKGFLVLDLNFYYMQSKSKSSLKLNVKKISLRYRFYQLRMDFSFGCEFQRFIWRILAAAAWIYGCDCTAKDCGLGTRDELELKAMTLVFHHV